MPYKDKEERKRKAAEWHQRNKKRNNAISKAWRKAHPERAKELVDLWVKAHKERSDEIKSSWVKNNPDKRKAASEKWYRTHKAIAKERADAYRRKHPHISRTVKARRRTRETKAGGSFTVVEWLALCMKYSSRCLCCGRRRKLTADHVIPVSKGGSSNIGNIQPLCKSCNSTKGTKVIDYRNTNLKETVPNQSEEK